MIDKTTEKPVSTTKQYGSPEKLMTKIESTPKVGEVKKKNNNGKMTKVNYVPWFVGPLMLGIVILAYIIMAIADIAANPIRAFGFLSIAAIGAAICIYYHYTQNV